MMSVDSVQYGQRQLHGLARVLCSALLLVCIGPAGLASDGDQTPAEAPHHSVSVTGFTAPFRTVTVAALHTGRIALLPAAEGELVKVGADLVQLDDAVQRQRVEIARALAESSLEVEIARLQLEQAQRELQRVDGLQQNSAACAKEWNDARSEADVARLLLAQARFKHEQAQREHALQQALLDELCLRAPFTGYVAEHLKEAGDTVEEREGVLTLVQLDPLLVVLDCQLELAAHVHVGQEVLVQPHGDSHQPRGGEVVFVNRVAEPASQTFRVKIRVRNDDADWIAGRRVSVDFSPTPPVAAAVDGTPTARSQETRPIADRNEGK